MDKKIKTESSYEFSEILQAGVTADSISAFMDSRIDMLSRSSDVRSVGIHTSCTGFIGADASIVSEGEISKRFFIDDPHLYDGLPSKVAQVYELLQSQHPELSEDESYFIASIHAVQFQQIEYFDNMIIGKRSLRAEMLGDYIDSKYPQETFSIAELKHVAMCMERAAVTHNMLRLLVIDSTLEVGELKVADGGAGGHAWLVVKGVDGVSRIFDPLNCHIIKDESGAIIGMKPLVEKFDGEREDVVATHKIITNNQTVEKHDLTYTFATEDELAFGKALLGR